MRRRREDTQANSCFDLGERRLAAEVASFKSLGLHLFKRADCFGPMRWGATI